MPFMEFRFLNGSTNTETADVTAEQIPPLPGPAQTQSASTVNAMEPGTSPPNPAGVDANEVSAAQVSTPTGSLALQASLPADPGHHFVSATTTLFEDSRGRLKACILAKQDDGTIKLAGLT